MGQPLRYEDPNLAWFITTRTAGSKLWFVNNSRLQERICAYLAKYQEQYGVLIYAFVIMGNHYHLVARFPNSNRTDFMRAFNSIIAKLTEKYVKSFKGRLWARRYSCEILPNPEDVEHWSQYTWLNPISSGLVQRISDYPGYNSFSDATLDRKKEYKVINWTKYQNRKRANPATARAEFIETYTLQFSRLPGHEPLDRKEYHKQMLSKIDARRLETIKQRTSEGKGFSTPEKLEETKPGDEPHSTKTSSRNSQRPLVLTLCRETRAYWLEFYFSLLTTYRDCSARFRNGELEAKFPPGTYHPPIWLSPHLAS